MTFPTRLQQVLDEWRAVIRSLVKIECGTGTYGFWNGNADLAWSGLTYWPNSLISVSEPVYGVGTAAANFTIELTAKRDFGLEPDKLLLIEALGPITAAADESLDQIRCGMDQRAAFEERLRVFAREDEAIAIRSKVNGLSRDAATALVSRGLKAVPGGFSWSSDPRLTLATPLRYTEDQILAVLRGIQAKTLLVLAQPEAPYLPRDMMQRRIREVRDIAVHRIDGSHHLHLENAAPIAGLIGEFFGWQAIFVTLAALALPALLNAGFRWHETRPSDEVNTRRSVLPIFVSPTFWVYTVGFSAGMGTFFVFFSTAPRMLIGQADYSEIGFSLAFATVALVMIVTTRFAKSFVARWGIAGCAARGTAFDASREDVIDRLSRPCQSAHGHSDLDERAMRGLAVP